ncbi:hypothetical protein DBT_0529 [Dissulfuribacter thermophilus]|uniref:Uncharacterized protein n=1 Tax=Dissulfuribacter thermophilus TaxID=1156395 RepID=A0A1B9F803_9BACT|nr:hypothetical protein [Dissulfuribacter thermophilus]OCC16067.1 hypothetical protein DBT_0529 [Dissulfuribacter thermophilus]
MKNGNFLTHEGTGVGIIEEVKSSLLTSIEIAFELTTIFGVEK